MIRTLTASESKRATFALWMALLILGLTGILAYETSVAIAETTVWIEHTHEVIDSLAAERAALTNVQVLGRAYGSSRNRARSAAYAEARESVAANGRTVRTLSADNPVQQRRLDDLEPLLAKRLLTVDAQATTTDLGAEATDLELAVLNEGHETDGRIDSLLSAMAAEEVRLLTARRSERSWTVRGLRLVQLGGTAISFALLVISFRRLRRETERRSRSEETAQKEEDSLAKILVTIADGVIATDIDGRLVRMNRIAEELTGWSAAACLGKQASEVFSVLDAETRAPVPDGIATALSERTSIESDAPSLLIQRDGTEVRVKDDYSLVRDANGVVHGAVIVFRDITEAWRAKTFFRALVEKSGDGIALTAADGTYLYASPAAARMLGCTADAVIGTNVLDYAHPDDVASTRSHNKKLAESEGTVGATERRIMRSDGTCAWIDVIGTNLVHDPAVGAVVRNMRDVTDRKASEGALRASEFRFARLYESGLVGISHADVFGNVRDANDAYLRLLGHSRADMRAGKAGWTAMTPPEWKSADDRALEQLQTTGVAPLWEKEFVRKDGSRVSVLLGAAMIDADECIAFVLDLSDRKRAEKSLRETEEQLRQAQKMDAVGRLAGGVAHDFNNMLSVILSYSDLLLSDLPPADPIRAELTEIKRAGQQAAELTSQLLMFSRQQVIEPKVVDLNDVLSKMENMLRRLLGADIDLTLTTRSLAKVLVDPSGIEHVVMNLIVNARDAMPTGGKLTIETADVVLDEEYARHHVGVVAGRHVMLSVTDSGMGMDAATRARIFDPFFTTKPTGKGTGLGLSTAFGLTAQNGGSIWVYSELGLGTTFKVYLPRAGVDVLRLPEVSITPTTLRGVETILLVEDEDQVRAVARGILARTGYKVIEARNAGEALLSCEQYDGTIHLLLSDVVMPQMSGPELAKRLSPARPDMRVLCMSGYTDDSIVRHGVLEAHFAFIQKPITPAMLTRKVREVLDAPRAA